MKSKGEEEEQQQQLQHTYLSKTFKQQQICFKNFKYYKNKRKKNKQKEFDKSQICWAKAAR